VSCKYCRRRMILCQMCRYCMLQRMIRGVFRVWTGRRIVIAIGFVQCLLELHRRGNAGDERCSKSLRGGVAGVGGQVRRWKQSQVASSCCETSEGASEGSCECSTVAQPMRQAQQKTRLTAGASVRTHVDFTTNALSSLLRASQTNVQRKQRTSNDS
jgi:hypothetical protein